MRALRRHGQAQTQTPVSVLVRDASVDFPLFDAKTRSLKATFIGSAGGMIGHASSRFVMIEALRGITLSPAAGDKVGLVGRNGAGESTLLRLVSGVYEPTAGVAMVDAGYENIIIGGLFLGKTRKSMCAKAGDIAEFTELGPACPCRCTAIPPACGCDSHWACSPVLIRRSCCSMKGLEQWTPHS